MDTKKFEQFRKGVKENISKVIVGKDKEIDKIIVSFICGGHVLLEDVPGLGKTKLARSLSKSLKCDFSRIQFTPDMLPSDLTGIYFYNQKEQEFVFRKGPLMSQIVLADEINRATPRTQSALLECMDEGQVTVEGNTKKLGSPFFVIATQNPVEQHGTFPLPEAQLDRFFMKLSLGYPDYNEEIKIMNMYEKVDPLESIEGVVTLDEIKYVQENYNKVLVKDEIKKYIMDIISQTRNQKFAYLGSSPRGTLALMRASQAHAAINGRDYVIPEDVKAMATSILAHRIIPHDSDFDFKTNEKSILKILDECHAPLEEV